MKLKKIASLALAGAMAVSMLAACGTDAGSSNSGEQGSTTNVSSVVEAVNDGQSGANAVKVTFTANSYLDSALQRAVEKLGYNAGEDEISDTVEKLVGATATYKSAPWASKLAGASVIGGEVAGQFLNNKVAYATDCDSKVGDQDGKTYTVVGVKKYAGASYYTEEAVLKAIAADVDQFVAKLSATSNDENNDGKLNATVVVSGANDTDKYYTYSYDGNVALTSVVRPNGQTDYYMAIVMHQDVAKATLK